MSAFAELAATARATPPVAALVLGSGMGQLVERLAPLVSLPFAEVPDMPPATVAGHKGRLTLGDWAGKRVLLFEGRLHYYEGHSWDRVLVPVRTAAALGAPVLLLTNAAGGIRDDLQPGSLMVLRDHIEWTRPYCWREPGPGGLGPGRAAPYSPRLIELLTGEGAAAAGVYAQLTGPSYETPAEIRALRTWGADAVGMSTAREAQAAAAAGMECAAVSLITNRAAGLDGGELDHGEVLTTARQAQERLGRLIEGLLQQLPCR
jgi:purine-nucleoside phosphorylase